MTAPPHVQRARAHRPAQRLGESWRAAVKAAGLAKGTRYHDLRRFYASALIAANLNPEVIQARLGHATIAETMDTYGHLCPDSGDLGRGAVDPRWLLATVTLSSDVRPAALDAAGRYVGWADAVAWAESQVGRRPVPVHDALAWRVGEGGVPR